MKDLIQQAKEVLLETKSFDPYLPISRYNGHLVRAECGTKQEALRVAKRMKRKWKQFKTGEWELRTPHFYILFQDVDEVVEFVSDQPEVTYTYID